ncbi:fatty acyl-CoA reductase wat-like [Drosophila bipectinata]|uniref:fatty acyl-CoA reductase wat-like n=1 Tax=Drosophila bipectinata TaxID=42026 RepID=UPI001C891434|nr:fatty acyl-CoA reductase wat-like [Drosophila bipectinata]
METEIQGFFRNKTVFITGGTGFLGKVVIEKLLRTTEVKKIYSLTREKRGKDIKERVEIWQSDPFFKTLLDTKPSAFDRVLAVAGNCLAPDLGLSEGDRRILTSEVQIVIHGAATVRFNEPLHVALAINTRASRLILQLARDMKQLVAYSHVSTTFSNCVIFRVKEIFYPEHLTCGSDKVLAMSELVSPQVLDGMESALKGSFPNTYTYTKALAEDVVLRESEGLPISVFRPAIITATWKDPVAGFIDNLYGPTAIGFGSGRGVLRLTNFKRNHRGNIVPVDFCANLILASLWHTANMYAKIPRNPKDHLPIYALAPTERNDLFSSDIAEIGLNYRDKLPMTKMIWYPFCINIPSPRLFSIFAFFYHTLPGYFFDLGLKISGRKPRLGKIYTKLHSGLAHLTYFLQNDFYFDIKNSEQLLSLMSPEDRRLYDFDMNSVDWRDYFDKGIKGMRFYLAKEEPTEESIQRGRRLLKKLKFLHYSLMTVLCCIFGILLWLLVGFMGFI